MLVREREGFIAARNVIDVARRNRVTPLGQCPLLFWMHVAKLVQAFISLKGAGSV